MNFIPYGKQFIDNEDINAVIETLSSDYLTTGPKIEEFEQKLCEITGAKYSVALSNGTAALHLSSICLLEKGDKVLTTPNSFLATANSILYVEAIPVFVDITKDGNIDLDICKQYLIKKKDIKAIYTVHFSGNPVNQDKLKYLREKYQVKILEDCSHSIGSYFKTQNGNIVKSGSCENSDVSTLSFHPVKHITTGEGGAITTNDEKIYKKLLKLRCHGMSRDTSSFELNECAFDQKGNLNPWYYEMQELGYNYRLTDIQSALGISQLSKLNTFIERRHEIAKKYDQAFFGNERIKPLYCFDNQSSYHLYVLLIDFEKLKFTKAEIVKNLYKKGIGTQIHYIPINKQPYYRGLGYSNEQTPVMDNYYKNCLSIPLFPSMGDKEVTIVSQEINNLINICGI